MLGRGRRRILRNPRRRSLVAVEKRFRHVLRVENAAKYRQSNGDQAVPATLEKGTRVKKFATAIAIAWIACNAQAYDTGTLTCETIGEFAARTLADKQSGTASADSLSGLVKPLAEDAAVERKLAANIVKLIYENDLIAAMKPADAYMVFMRDCMNGKMLASNR